MRLCHPNAISSTAIVHFRCLSLGCVVVALCVTSPSIAQTPAPTVIVAETAAREWKQSQLANLEKELADATDREKKSELRAAVSWVRAWQPGRMDRLDDFEARQETLRSEPDLSCLRDKIPNAEPALEEAVALQQRLRRLDAVDVRKENLHETDAAGEELVGVLESIPTEALDAKTRDILKWAIAFTRYRQARALGYQELPDVVERQPIADPSALDRRLRQVHGKLQALFDESQPEFVLLDVRMLRRDQRYGQALQLLERHRGTILGKWYLKKRRDLLEEAGWIPPWKEAAAIYQESGLASELP